MNDSQLAVIDRNSVNDIVQQVALIQQVMERVMKKDEHYGRIPGCGPKPTLLKPGAQKLCLTFRLVPKYTWHEEKYPDDHVRFVVTCQLIHQPTGQFAGEGMGIASSHEKKWVKQLPVDVYNTVLKMACKRAYIDATINATAASDIFTQDVEDMGRVEAPQPEPQQPAPQHVEEVQVLEGPITEIYVHKEWTYAQVKGIEFSTKRPEIAQQIMNIEENVPVRVTVKKMVVQGGKIKFRPVSIEVLVDREKIAAALAAAKAVISESDAEGEAE